MPLDIIIIIFASFAVAAYLLINRSLVNIISGFVIISNGVNLFILASSGSPQGKEAPIIQEKADFLMVDPLPQAMILTAIVIGLGMLAFLATLIYKVYMVEGKDDTRQFLGRKK